MKSFAWRAMALLTVTVFVLSMSADANAARRSSLGGNQLIDDADDMFAFPHLLKMYKNSAIIDMAPSPSYPSFDMMGRGTVTFGSEESKWAWQFNTGRADYLDNTAWWAWGGFDRELDIFSPFLDGSALQWWDVGVATSFGENNWGLTFSWASDSEKITPEGEDPIVDNSTSMFSLQLGTDLANIDWAIEFGTGSFKDKDPTLDPSDVNDENYTTFAIAARGRRFEAGGLDWRWLAAFATQMADPKEDGVEKYSATGFRADFGPVWGTERDWLLSAYIYFDYTEMQEPNFDAANAKDTFTSIVFPGYNIAMEYYITKWLAMRGSIFSHYSMETYKTEGTTADNGEIKEKFFDAFWTIGLGFDKESWGLDLALEESYLHTGYLPFGADLNEDNVIALITAWLRW